MTAGSAGQSQIELDGVIAETATNTNDITDIKIGITDLQAKTAFIESVTASSTTQTERTTYLNDEGGIIGYIGPQGDSLTIGCSASKNLTINPDQGYISHYCENTFFGDNYGPGRLILVSNNGNGGSITLNSEVQNNAYTDADHARLNTVDSDMTSLQNQINTTNTDVSAVATENVATQVQLDLVAADLATAETFITGHTDDIVDLTVLINTNKTNIELNDVEIADILTEIDTINTNMANAGNTASNQTQVDAIQLTVNAHTDDITDHTNDIATNIQDITELTTLVNTSTTNIDANDVDIASINTQLGTINTNISTVSSGNTATQTQVDTIQTSLDSAEITITGHTTDIVDNKNEITDNQSQIVILGGRVTNNDTDI